MSFALPAAPAPAPAAAPAPTPALKLSCAPLRPAVGSTFTNDVVDVRIETLATLPSAGQNVQNAASKAKQLFVFLCDISGSMLEPIDNAAGAPSKISLLKKTLVNCLNLIPIGSRVGIQGFNTRVTTASEFVELDRLGVGKEVLIKVIETLDANDGTDIYNALEGAIFRLKKFEAINDYMVNIMLLTDGLPTSGPMISQHMIMAMNNLLKREPWFKGTLNTFGFGIGHDATLLTNMAKRLDGMFVYQASADQLSESFESMINLASARVAQRLELSIEAADGVQITEVLTRFPYQLHENKRVTLQISDIAKGESRDILINVDIPDSAPGNANFPVLKATLKYFDLSIYDYVEVQANATVMRMADVNFLSLNAEVMYQYHRIQVTDAISKACNLADEHRFAEAQATVHDMQLQLRASIIQHDPRLAELQQKLAEIEPRIATNELYLSDGKSFSMSSQQEFGNQRTIYHKKARPLYSVDHDAVAHAFKK